MTLSQGKSENLSGGVPGLNSRGLKPDLGDPIIVLHETSNCLPFVAPVVTPPVSLPKPSVIVLDPPKPTTRSSRRAQPAVSSPSPSVAVSAALSAAGGVTVSGDIFTRRLMQAAERSNRIRRRVLVGVLGVALVGGVAGWLTVSSVNARQQKLAAVKLFQARSQVEQRVGEIESSAAAISRMVVTAQGHVVTVTNAVSVVMGAWSNSVVPVVSGPEMQAVPPVVAESVPTTTDGVVVVVETAPVTPAAAAAAQDGPPGEATREELDRARGQAAAPAAAPVSAPRRAATSKPVPVAVAPAPVLPPEQAAARAYAQSVASNAASVDEKAFAAAALREDACRFRDEAVKAAAAEEVDARMPELVNRLETCRTMEREARTALAECERIARSADALRLSTEAELQRKQQALAEEARRIAGEQTAKRMAEELRQLTERELQGVHEARKQCDYLIKTFDFKKAAETVKAQEGTFTTEPGKAAIHVVVERYVLLATLKERVVDELKARPFRWGWISPGQDIVGADATSVILRDRKVSWSEIGSAQLVKIFDHCVASSAAHYKVRAENALAAAVYFHEVGATETAKRYADMAVELSVSMKDPVERLLTRGEQPRPAGERSARYVVRGVSENG